MSKIGLFDVVWLFHSICIFEVVVANIEVAGKCPRFIHVQSMLKDKGKKRPHQVDDFRWSVLEALAGWRWDMTWNELTSKQVETNPKWYPHSACGIYGLTAPGPAEANGKTGFAIADQMLLEHAAHSPSFFLIVFLVVFCWYASKKKPFRSLCHFWVQPWRWMTLWQWTGRWDRWAVQSLHVLKILGNLSWPPSRY